MNVAKAINARIKMKKKKPTQTLRKNQINIEKDTKVKIYSLENNFGFHFLHFNYSAFNLLFYIVDMPFTDHALLIDVVFLQEVSLAFFERIIFLVV